MNGKKSLQRELDDFCKELSGRDFSIREVTKGAFSQARAKLNYTAFIELNDNVNKTFYEEAPYKVWHQMRLLSIDGTRLLLPNHPSVKEEFGSHGFGPNADSERSLATASCLYDCANLLTIDAQIAPYTTSERELLHKHLEKVNKGDLLLLDRGYPSLAIFFLLFAKGIEFCVRMKEDWWLQIKDFKESGKKEDMVTFSLPKKDYKLLKDYPELKKEMQCRLVQIELDNGETQILCTSLLDTKKIPRKEIVELYHYRWNIEESYKLFKARAEVESFSGKTALAVKQDFYARIFTMSFCAVLAFPIEKKLKKEYQKNKHKHEKTINRTTALAMIQKLTIPMFLKKLHIQSLQAFDEIVTKTTEIVRKGRLFKRKKKPKRLYHMNYKNL